MSTPATDDWVARSLRAVWHPCTQMKHHERLPLIPVARGAGGAWGTFVPGHRFLDSGYRLRRIASSRASVPPYSFLAASRS